MNARWVNLVLICLFFPSLAGDFGFEDVRSEARALAAREYQRPVDSLPEPLAHLSYDEYDSIQFDFNKALWRKGKLPYQVEFFPPGGNHKYLVALHEIAGQTVNPIPFRRDYFDGGTNLWLELPGLGFAGFRITHPPKHFGEVAVFLDATYFRMIGRGQVYGTSARGIALNTAADQSEEFPAFRQFWFLRPDVEDQEITLYALMDGPSVTGAYQFIIRAGVETIAQVKAAIFSRREVKQFGIAPLTSMFLQNESQSRSINPGRREVHDADGLLMYTGSGDWIWRPLENGRMIRVNAFADENPRGFGLMQRDREYDHYRDDRVHFEKRPSVWVRPLGQWGKGAVELIQLPSSEEYLDNVVAFWVPATPPAPGGIVEVDYELRWTLTEISPPALGQVQSTQVEFVNASEEFSNVRFVVDFRGEKIKRGSAKGELTADVHCSETGKLVRSGVSWNKARKVWQLVMEIAPPEKAVDLRARLKRADVPVTETWVYTWQP